MGIIPHARANGLFFRRLKVDFMEAWDDEGEAIIYSLP
jgi:hypothetical protein